MTLELPNLDDRQFQDIVDEAKKRINYHCPEWTDHNVSDPGVTMIELFAWMMDMLLYRVNQMPRRHYIEMLNLLGVKLKEPVAAKVTVTFWLSTAVDHPKVIKAGTEVSTTQTETTAPVIFITDRDLEIQPPQLAAIKAWKADEENSREFYASILDKLSGEGSPKGTGIEEANDQEWPAIFSAHPRHGQDVLYFGFENDVSSHLVRFKLTFAKAQGKTATHEAPPYIWQAYTGSKTAGEEGWQPVDVDRDTTGAMNKPGIVELHLPQAMKKHQLPNDETGQNDYYYWVRVKLKAQKDFEDGVTPFKASPRLGQVDVTACGGTVEATHCQIIEDEFLGHYENKPDQRFFLQNTPVLKRQPGEHLLVKTRGHEQPQPWAEQEYFSANSSEEKLHYTLDSITGELRFGPAVQTRDGSMKHYGAVPDRGATLIFKQYRSGGGSQGNVGPGEIDTLRSSIAYVDRVKNRKEPVRRGLDAESLEEAMLRAPGLLHSRERAVTEEDFEFLVLHEFNKQEGENKKFDRVKCLSRDTGTVTVLIIPHIEDSRNRQLRKEDELKLAEEDRHKLETYLKERCLLTTRLEIDTPTYIQVTVRVEVTVRASANVDRHEIQQAIEHKLYNFLSPLAGGADGKGWPFSHGLTEMEVYRCLGEIRLPDMVHIDRVALVDERTNNENKSIKITGSREMLISGQHEVMFREDQA